MLSTQALSKAIKLYQSAADKAGSHAADEAGTAALSLAFLCDTLLKVPPVPTLLSL